MRAYASLKDRVEEKIEPVPFSGCWLWTGTIARSSGYGAIRDDKEHNFKMESAHRASYRVFVGPIGSLSVLHKCDVRICVNPSHLYLGTDLDNAKDRASRGRNNAPIGERQGGAKLTWMMVDEIRNSNATGKELANLFGVSQACISNVKSGNHWRVNGYKKRSDILAGNRKLTDDQIIKIINDNRSQRKISRDYGVSQSAISKIKKRVGVKNVCFV